MRHATSFGSFLLASLAFAANASAATWYVAPTGTATSGCDSRDCPCSLSSAAYAAVAGDTVVLMDGVYKEQLYVTNTGTADAWITFKADDCATPIVEGPGYAPTADEQTTGIGSTVATYVRFIGIVSRGWSSGFGNGWTGEGTTNSNGNWELEYCIGQGNGRTGFTFYSAQNFKLKHSISAHNGSSTLHSWSSGVTLYSSTGTNVIEGNVAFENMDAEKHTDGSGFIVDEASHGALFVNNLAFRNGGSCLRLTKSQGTRFINNTCYHDAQDSLDMGPTNPGELYFTKADDNSTTTSTTFMNNVLIATGTGPGANAVYNKPTTGWANNVEGTGSVSYFTALETDYTLAASATSLIGKGGSGTDVPTNDLGFDPKCIVKRAPTLVGETAAGGWWQHDIDIDYIKSIGGVAKCFNPGTRTAPVDIGAYKNGAVTTVPAGMCTPAPVTGVCAIGGTGGMGGMGAGGDATAGMTSAGGAPATGGTGPGAGAPATGGTAPSAGAPATGVGGTTGGTAPAGGTPGAAGNAVSGSAGTTTTGTGGTGPATGGATGAGGTTSAGGTTAAGTGGTDEGEPSGCGCRIAAEPNESRTLAALGLVGLGAVLLRRRRRAH
jgi:MYXO-CTERM domain-containing protein